MDKAVFFNRLRNGLMGPTLDQDEVEGSEAVLDAMDGLPVAWVAYALATAYHETNGTMQPVREAYWLSEGWRSRNLRYYPWYGRGYVQLTWKTNYVRADKELGLGGTLIGNLDRAMEPVIAAKIMRRGMVEGWFTSHTLARHLPSDKPASLWQFRQARRIINGTDKALKIAGEARQFQKALLDAGYSA